MRIGALALLSVLILVAPARGEPAGRHWYGWQTLIVDGATLAAAIPAAHEEELGVVAGAVIASSITAPILHARRGHWGRAGVSLTMRLLLGYATVMGVVDAADCHDRCNDNGEIYALAPIGIVAALDAGVIAWESRPAAVPPPTPSLTPTMITRPGNLLIGVAGSW